MGMLIDNTHADNVHSFIRGGESQSTLFLDGRKNPWPAAVGPTIFVDVDPASTLSREEIFGPVLVVTRFKSEEEALKLANDSDYGLAPRCGPAISPRPPHEPPPEGRLGLRQQL